MKKEKAELELKTNREGYDIYYKWHIVWNISYDIYIDWLYEEREKAFMAWLQFNQEEVKKWKMVADENGTHYDMLEEENRKLKDEFMLKLAEAFLLPPTSNQMAVYKERNYSKWYDEIKDQMRKEIKEWM